MAAHSETIGSTEKPLGQINEQGTLAKKGASVVLKTSIRDVVDSKKVTLRSRPNVTLIVGNKSLERAEKRRKKKEDKLRRKAEKRKNKQKKNDNNTVQNSTNTTMIPNTGHLHNEGEFHDILEEFGEHSKLRNSHAQFFDHLFPAHGNPLTNNIANMLATITYPFTPITLAPQLPMFDSPTAQTPLPSGQGGTDTPALSAQEKGMQSDTNNKNLHMVHDTKVGGDYAWHDINYNGTTPTHTYSGSNNDNGSWQEINPNGQYSPSDSGDWNNPAHLTPGPSGLYDIGIWNNPMQLTQGTANLFDSGFNWHGPTHDNVNNWNNPINLGDPSLLNDSLLLNDPLVRNDPLFNSDTLLRSEQILRKDSHQLPSLPKIFEQLNIYQQPLLHHPPFASVSSASHSVPGVVNENAQTVSPDVSAVSSQNHTIALGSSDTTDHTHTENLSPKFEFSTEPASDSGSVLPNVAAVSDSVSSLSNITPTTDSGSVLPTVASDKVMETTTMFTDPHSLQETTDSGHGEHKTIPPATEKSLPAIDIPVTSPPTGVNDTLPPVEHTSDHIDDTHTQLPAGGPNMDLPDLTEGDMGKSHVHSGDHMRDKSKKDPHEGHIHVELTNKRLNKSLRRMCKRNYYGYPKGKMCCMRTAECFTHLPDLIEEIRVFEQKHVDKNLVCRHVKGALSCMSSTLQQPDCLPTAKAINRKFKPQLERITHFFDPGCIDKLPSFNTTATPKPTGPGGNGNTLNHGNGHDHSASHFNAGVIGAAAGGVALLIIMLLCCLIWRCKRRRRRPSEDIGKNNVSNQSYETAMTRYKHARERELGRQNSDTYAEIDERRMRNIRTVMDNDRPLPSAPDGNQSLDRQGYLTPQGTPTKSRPTGGYAVLQTGKDGTVSYTRTYASLSDEEGDYIFPDYDQAAPKRRSGNVTDPGIHVDQNAPAPSSGAPENPYHAYFILEKEKQEEKAKYKQKETKNDKVYTITK